MLLPSCASAFSFHWLAFRFRPRNTSSAGANPFLGVVSDFSYLQLGYVVIRIKEKRRRKLRAELRKVIEDGTLTPAHAARLRGKLYFSTCSSFFGVGRAALQAFTKRQYNKHGTSKLTPELRQSVKFFVAFLVAVPPRRAQVREDGRPPIYVWTDAMFELMREENGDCVLVIDEVTGGLFHIWRC